jgi:hypothetical protein
MRYPFLNRAAFLLLPGVAGLVVLGAALGGCASGGAGACTRIGCYSGAFFHLDGALPESYAVALYIAGEAPRVVECAPAEECGGRVFFEGVTARNVEIEITGEGGLRIRQDVTLSYTTTQPNGPDCPPICRQATARVQLRQP